MDYCNRVQGFINYTLFNPININGDDIRYPCKMCENKKFLDLVVVMMHLLYKKKGLLRDTCVSLHIENYMFLTRPW